MLLLLFSGLWPNWKSHLFNLYIIKWLVNFQQTNEIENAAKKVKNDTKTKKAPILPQIDWFIYLLAVYAFLFVAEQQLNKKMFRFYFLFSFIPRALWFILIDDSFLYILVFIGSCFIDELFFLTNHLLAIVFGFLTFDFNWFFVNNVM